MIERFDRSEFAAGVHHDEDVSGDAADAAGLVKDIVVRYDKVFRPHVAEELAVLIEREDIEFNLFGDDANALIRGRRGGRGLRAAALGIAR